MLACGVLARLGGEPDRFPGHRRGGRGGGRAVLGWGAGLAGGEARYLGRVDRRRRWPVRDRLPLCAGRAGACKNWLHLDVRPVNRDQAAGLSRLLALGARQPGVGEGDRKLGRAGRPRGQTNSAFAVPDVMRRILGDWRVFTGTVTCGNGRGWTRCRKMACKRSGIRISIASIFFVLAFDFW